MKIVGIYKITSLSGKVYIGQSWDIAARWRQYRAARFKGAQPKLLASFRKYGVASHTFAILYEAPATADQYHLNIMEQFLMDEFRSEHVLLLNIREGGSHGRQSPESIRKMVATRQANGSYTPTAETRQKYRDAQHRRTNRPKHSEETKQLLSRLATGRVPSADACEKNRQSQLGRTHSQETKTKIAAGQIGRKRPDLAALNRLRSRREQL